MAPTILLINPPIYDFAAYDLFNKPLGLLYLAAILRARGYQVRTIDALDRNFVALDERQSLTPTKPNGTGKYHSEIIEKPQCLGHVPRHYRRYGLGAEMLAVALAAENDEHRPSAICVTSMMTYWYPAVADTIELIRRTIPAVPIGLGGVYATLMPEHAAAVCRPDVLFSGAAGLEQCLEWLDRLCPTKSRPRYAPRHGSVGVGGKALHESFSTWPAPAYDLYRRLDYLTVMTSLGCPFRCDYCASSLLQRHLQQLAPETFVGQLAHLLGFLDDQSPRLNVALMDDALLADAEAHIIPILRRTAKLSAPLRFHCPNGLHSRFVSRTVADLMYANHFEMIRLSYESARAQSLAQRASDQKVADGQFEQALFNLQKAGFRSAQLDAYILAGLPGQTIAEVTRSATVVHDLGLRVRLCLYTPIKGTKLFDVACRRYRVDPNEPLLHNNSLLPILDREVGWEVFRQLKAHVTQLNLRLGSDDTEMVR